jgi:Acetyltransferase (GNAT) family
MLNDKLSLPVVIRTACTQDIDPVVAIHMEAFPGFFLTKLGPKFLKLMYEAFLQDEVSVFAVAVINGSVIGFATGAAQQGTQVQRMAGKRVFRLAQAILPALCRSPFVIAKHLFVKLFAIDGHPTIDADSVILRSIAVTNNSLGTGAAVELLRFFEKQVNNSGFHSVSLTTDAVANDRVNSFYIKAGYIVKSHFTQKPDRLMILYQKKLVSN